MPLAEDVGQPLRLADGRLVYPDGRIDGGKSVGPIRDVPSRIVAKRRATDLPDAPRVMNAVAVVLAYTLYGLDHEEIAAQTNMKPHMIERIRASEPYVHLHDALVRSVLDADTEVVRDMLSQNAKAAATVMVDGLNAGSRSDRMAAARDILDRSGHRPADVVEHRHRVDGGLVIEYVRRDESKEVPTIDMDTL